MPFLRIGGRPVVGDLLLEDAFANDTLRCRPAVSPMAPTFVREFFHRDDWVYEEKVDGWRILAYKAGDRVRLVSRNGRDHTRRFADIAAAVAKLSPRSLVLDGEVAMQGDGVMVAQQWVWVSDPPPLPGDLAGRCARGAAGRRGPAGGQDRSNRLAGGQAGR
jgi:ATP dependent DNA ligase domain